MISYFGWDTAFWIGLGSTILGFWVLRATGSAASAEMQKALQGKQAPSKKVLHHLTMGFAGFLLILPGFLGDLLGLILLIPGIRHLILFVLVWRYGSKLIEKVSSFASQGGARGGPFGGRVFTYTFGGSAGPGPRPLHPDPRDQGDYIDVTATVLPNDQLPKPRSDDHS